MSSSSTPHSPGRNGVRVGLVLLGLVAVAAPALLPSACGGEPEGSPGGAGAASSAASSATSSGAGGHGGGATSATTSHASTTSSTATSGAGGATTSSTKTSTSTLGGDGWLPFPAEGCDAEYILNPPDWPKRVWTSCGAGCLVANANSIGAPWSPERWASGAKVVGGEVYILTGLTPSGQQIQEVTRLSDGKALVALRHTYPKCGPSGGKRQAPFILDLFTDYEASKEKLSVYQPKTGTLSILEGDLFIHTVQDYFTWEDGWGLMDAGRIRVGLTPGSAETTTVFDQPGEYWTARAHKDMAIWVDWSSYPLKIWRWTKKLGVGVLFQAPDYDIRPALSDTTVAWVGGHRDPETPYIHIATELYWAPWSTTSLVPVKGPDITGMSSRDVELIAGDDYVALFAGGPETGPIGVIVVQMSTQKKWYLYAPPGDHRLLPRAISKTELLVQELGPQPKLEFLNYRRYDLSRLDESSGPWPGPP